MKADSADEEEDSVEFDWSQIEIESYDKGAKVTVDNRSLNLITEWWSLKLLF